MIGLYIALGVVVILLLWAVGQYNGLVKLRNLVQEAWRQIDVELQRRHDMIPNLVQTVKGYAAHERETFEAVTNARASASQPNLSPAEHAEQENVLTQALGKLFAVVENYPELKANTLFQQLQTELTNTEDRIAAGRRFYNANVRTMNTKVETFPSSIIAGMFGFHREEYFETQDEAARQAPTVSFDNDAAPTVSPGDK